MSQTNTDEHSGSTDCSELPLDVVLRHKRGFEALRQSFRDLKDVPEMNQPSQIDDYLQRVPFSLRGKMRKLLNDLAVGFQGE